MADITLTKLASVLYEMRAPLQSLFPTRNFLLNAWAGHGSDGSPGQGVQVPSTMYNGSKVRIPVDTAPMQAGGWVAEGGTVNVPIAPTITQAEITLKKFVQPFGITLEAMQDSRGGNSAIDAVAMSVQKARIAIAENLNLAMNGDANNKLADVLSGGTLTFVLGDGAAGVGVDWDKLYVGQVVDVLTEATGADAGQGLRRKIASITKSTGTVVFSTTQQASDGGSGSITATSASALYVPGSFVGVGGTGTSYALEGGLAAAGQGTTFQQITLATYPQFKAVDGRDGDTTSLPFSDAMIDLGVTLGQRAGDGVWDFGIGDPNAINVYKNAKQNQVRFSVPTGTVAGRFTGVQVDLGNQVITIVPERKHEPGVIRFLARNAATMYASTAGPDFENEAGGTMFKQFSRTTDYEVWVYWRPEWGWHNPSKIVNFADLAVQSTSG